MVRGEREHDLCASGYAIQHLVVQLIFFFLCSTNHGEQDTGAVALDTYQEPRLFVVPVEAWIRHWAARCSPLDRQQVVRSTCAVGGGEAAQKKES